MRLGLLGRGDLAPGLLGCSRVGSRLREIGSKARLQMERLFGRKVFLETWVRVRQGWSNDEAALRALGYGE